MAEPNLTTFTVEELATEEWRPVVGWEGRYEVSNLGRVKTPNYRGSGRERLFCPVAADGHGYVHVHLRRPQRSVYIHVLVALAFLGPRPDGHGVNHIDGVKRNCRVINLEWVTPFENTRHAVRTGLVATGARNGSYTNPKRRPYGDRNGSRLHPESRMRGAEVYAAKLTDAAVRTIKQRLASGEYQKDIARDFGVWQSAISAIAVGKTWRHVI